METEIQLQIIELLYFRREKAKEMIRKCPNYHTGQRVRFGEGCVYYPYLTPPQKRMIHDCHECKRQIKEGLKRILR